MSNERFLIKRQTCRHIETCHHIWFANQLIGFYRSWDNCPRRKLTPNSNSNPNREGGVNFPRGQLSGYRFYKMPSLAFNEFKLKFSWFVSSRNFFPKKRSASNVVEPSLFNHDVQKIKFSIKETKCDQIRSFLLIWLHFLK